MRKARWIVGILVILLAFLLWWSIASNYDYGSLAGTYVLRNGKITCALHLRTDQTYTEQLTTKTGIQKANGN